MILFSGPMRFDEPDDMLLAYLRTGAWLERVFARAVAEAM